MEGLRERVEGIAGMVRGLRSVCPDGPLWDRVAALQLEVALLRGEMGEEREKGQEKRDKGGFRDGKMAAAGDRSMSDD